VQDILRGEIECSETMKQIYLQHAKLYPDDDLIDLQPKSQFIIIIIMSIFLLNDSKFATNASIN